VARSRQPWANLGWPHTRETGRYQFELDGNTVSAASFTNSTFIFAGWLEDGWIESIFRYDRDHGRLLHALERERVAGSIVVDGRSRYYTRLRAPTMAIEPHGKCGAFLCDPSMQSIRQPCSGSSGLQPWRPEFLHACRRLDFVMLSESL
jgi:hypothetical protein